MGPLRAPQIKFTRRLAGCKEIARRQLTTFSIRYNILRVNNSLTIAFLNIAIVTHPCQKQRRGSGEKWSISIDVLANSGKEWTSLPSSLTII